MRRHPIGCLIFPREPSLNQIVIALAGAVARYRVSFVAAALLGAVASRKSLSVSPDLLMPNVIPSLSADLREVAVLLDVDGTPTTAVGTRSMLELVDALCQALPALDARHTHSADL